MYKAQPEANLVRVEEKPARSCFGWDACTRFRKDAWAIRERAHRPVRKSNNSTASSRGKVICNSQLGLNVHDTPAEFKIAKSVYGHL